MRVLIVDDDEISCEILACTLGELGFETTSAIDGAAAMEILNDNTFDAVLCDWEMPRVDGPTLCRWIRANPRFRSVYIVMLTGREGAANTADGIASGADTFLCKPCDPSEVAQHLHLGAHLLAREAASGA